MTEANQKYLIDYVPAAAKPRKAPNPAHQGQEDVPAEIDVAPSYAGKLVMRLPTWKQRLDFMAIMGATPDSPGGAKDGAKQVDAVGRLSEVVPDFLVSIHLVRVADQLAIDSWDDVLHEGELAQSLVPEMAIWLIGKHNIGNPSQPS